jgi:hypothetical protein
VQNLFEATVYPSLKVDTDGDLVPDQILSALGTAAPPICRTGDATTARLPWPFGIEVSVVRAGTTAPVVIATTQTATGNFDFSLVTAYDEVGDPVEDVLINPPSGVSIAGGTALAYTNGTRTHTGSESYLVNCVSASPLPAYSNTTFQVERGDLVKVMARRSSSAPSGLGGRASRFSITLLLNGVPVEVRGNSSTDESGSDVTFTYLVN